MTVVIATHHVTLSANNSLTTQMGEKHEILCVFVCAQDYLHKIVCGSQDFHNSSYTNIRFRSLQKCALTLTIL